MAPRYVFVGGLHGSGTSLVHRWLRAHPDISGFQDAGVPEDEGQHLQSVLPTARSLGGLGRFGFQDGAHLTEGSPLASSETAAALLESWEPHWDSSCGVRVEKSPPNLLRFRLLQALFPGALCVAVVRHPLGVAWSTRDKRRRNRLRSLDTLLSHWLHCHRLYEEDRPQVTGLVELRYEDLVVDPEAGLRVVFESLGLDSIPSPEALDPDRDRHHGERWAARLGRPPRPRKVLSREKEVARWGYSLRDFALEHR